MSTTANVRLCELSTTLDQDWRTLYTSAFPVAEQEPEQKLQNLIDTNRLLYHKTVGKQGELLCFSMLSLAPDFTFLAYIATDPNQRSGGYGSKHMRALIDQIKQQNPGHVGMFLEIDSTNPRNIKLTDEEKNIRQRRLSFYRRLGAKRLCRGMNYSTPARTGTGDHELDVLFFPFNDKALDHTEKQRIVLEIYQRFYCLNSTDAIVSDALASIKSCPHSHCEDEPQDQSAGGQAPQLVADTTGSAERNGTAASVTPLEQKVESQAAPTSPLPGSAQEPVPVSKPDQAAATNAA
ncbi:MAG: GNAT family N-acetyltransferase [Candidatus Obscuribacterales bacterium]|nr:GNAT family N-acetyltransferase [Candidatus Obscuribacterales bacterium]